MANQFGGPPDAVDRALGVGVWALLAWMYYAFTQDYRLDSYPDYIAAVPLGFGWLMLIRALQEAIVPLFSGAGSEETPFAYFPSVLTLLLLAIVMRAVFAKIRDVLDLLPH